MGKCDGASCKELAQACGADGDCCSRVCTSGACASPKAVPVGDPCAGASSCWSNTCTAGLCACAPDASKCVADADCCTGSCLDDGSGMFTCVKPCEAGGACAADMDCCDPTTPMCDKASHTCAPAPCVSGGICQSNQECCGSQVCDTNTATCVACGMPGDSCGDPGTGPCCQGSTCNMVYNKCM